MGTVTILLILLCLLQGTGSQNLRLQVDSVLRGSGQKVKLECAGGHGDSMDQGIFWFRQKKNEKNPEGIVFLSLVNKEFYRDQQRFSHFKAEKSGSVYTLTIQSFQNEDQGTYYCMSNKNSFLTFSPGLQLLYPEVTTPKPTTTKPPPTTSKSGDDCSCNTGKKDSANTKAESWKIDCAIHIWAPLVGLCGFLLICLLTTAIMLCFRTRRRRCRCKHRPLEERNGQMNLMNKHKK